MKVHLPMVALAVLAVAGCGSGSGSGSKGSVGAGSGPALNGEQSKTPMQILADTKSALFNARAVHVKGSMSAHGQTETLDLQLQGQDSAGTETLAGSTIRIVSTGGKLYINAPAAFWTKTLGAALAPRLANKWLVQPAGNNPLASGLTLQGIAASLKVDSPLTPKVVRGSTAGHPSVTISQQDGSTITVANTGPAQPLALINKGKSKGELDFTNYGITQAITVPPGAISAAQAAKSPAPPAHA